MLAGRVSYNGLQVAPQEKNTAVKAPSEWVNKETRQLDSIFRQRNFFCGATWRATCIKTQPAGTPDIKQPILCYSEAIPQDLMQSVIASLPGRTQECRGGDWSRLKNVTFECWAFQLLFPLINNVCIYLFIHWHMLASLSGNCWIPTFRRKGLSASSRWGRAKTCTKCVSA
jgi:hypothetical protein